MMRILKSLPFTIMVSALLIFMIALCISGTVISQERNKSRIEEKYYRELEHDYVEEIRSFLAQEGYKNSGVTMTKIIEESGMRNYTVTIHHRKINSLTEKEKAVLEKKCGRIEFPVKGCGFSHKFLEEDF